MSAHSPIKKSPQTSGLHNQVTCNRLKRFGREFEGNLSSEKVSLKNQNKTLFDNKTESQQKPEESEVHHTEEDDVFFRTAGDGLP